jgi:hypothetical protein
MDLLYKVELGIDRAAKDTHKRVLMLVRGKDSLSAAIKAEELTDAGLDDPVEYSHAMSCSQVTQSMPAATVFPLALAA